MVNKLYIAVGGNSWQKNLSDYELEGIKAVCKGQPLRSLTYSLFVPLRVDVKKIRSSLLFPLTSLKVLKIRSFGKKIAAICFSVFIDLLTLPIRVCLFPWRYGQLQRSGRETLPFFQFLKKNGLPEAFMKSKSLKVAVLQDITHSLDVKVERFTLYLKESIFNKQILLKHSTLVAGPSQKIIAEYQRTKTSYWDHNN